MQFNKPPLSVSDQINLLRQRGLQISDISKAEQHLTNIGYYRLKLYTYPFQDRAYSTFTFVSGTTFDQILDLYYFDGALRILVFQALRKIEIALRIQLVNQLAIAHGSH